MIINIGTSGEPTQSNTHCYGLTLELATHFFITISICISIYYASSQVLPELCYYYAFIYPVQTEHKEIEIYISNIGIKAGHQF